MTNLGYAWEKLFSAVLSMAMGENNVQSRLYDAFLGFHTLKTEDFPEDLQKDFNEIMNKLTEVKTQTGNEGIVRATLNVMSDMDARNLAENIVSLYTEITRRDAIERA